MTLSKISPEKKLTFIVVKQMLITREGKVKKIVQQPPNLVRSVYKFGKITKIN